MKALLLLVLCMTSFYVKADVDGAYLDAPYKDLISPVDDLNDKSINKNIAIKSDTLAIATRITPVRSQMNRGTCSIFSATALLEASLVLNGYFNNDIDLSEEWLEYLVIAPYRRTSDGSNSFTNFSAISRFGMPFESTLPYIGDEWTESTNYNTQESRCGHLNGQMKESCFIAHFDPSFYSMNTYQLSAIDYADADLFLKAKEEALKNKQFINVTHSNYRVGYRSWIKEYLQKGIPLTMGIDFYYGAWNHSKATTLGIGRDIPNWYNGIVGNPVAGSVDYTKSRENRAGHSVLIVGYDDNKIVKTTVKMADGTMKEFTYQGVYYFKNSWGISSFGRDFELDGVSLPGYGMITYEYANRMGSFYTLPLK